MHLDIAAMCDVTPPCIMLTHAYQHGVPLVSIGLHALTDNGGGYVERLAGVRCMIDNVADGLHPCTIRALSDDVLVDTFVLGLN